MDVERHSERAAVAGERFARLHARAKSVPIDSDEARAVMDSAFTAMADAVAEMQHTVDDLATANRELRAAADRYAGLFDLAPDAYLVTTPDGVVRDANREASALFKVDHWSASAPLAAVIAPEDQRKFYRFLRRVWQAEEPMELEVTMRRLDRSTFPATLRAVAADDAIRGPVVRWLVRDETVRRAVEARLAHEATHDVMTGIPNRSAFVAMLEAALVERLRDDRRVAVLFIDLDAFKAVNDRFGHDTGDQLLQAVVARIRGGLRDGDVLGRLGGDEFAAACVVDNRVEAVQIAERVRQEVGRPYAIRAQAVRTTASIGVALAAGSDEADDVIGQADIAMYRAKRLQKNRVEVYGDALHEATLARRELDRSLRGALRRQELSVWYQPTIDLRDGRVTAVEALLRWELPGRGVLTAADFLDVAEEYGLLVPIGEWVLREACRQSAVWQRQFTATTFLTSVNVTPLELVQTDVAHSARSAIEESGADPQRICLELAERTVVSIGDVNPRVLGELHDLGVRIGIDNFGTGYTSLAQLRHLPVDLLKLDPRLLERVETDREDRLIVRAVAELGNALGVDVVGEGVERRGQAEVLTEVGCNQAQGFFLAAPQPAAQVTSLIATCNGQH